MECLSKKADDGDRKAAMVQLQEAGGFEAVVELAGSRGAAAALSAPAPAPSQGFGGMQAFGMLSVAASSPAPAQADPAEEFAAQLMSKHVAPFLVSSISDSASAVLVSAVRQHLGSKKLPVIKAYVEARVIAALL